MLISILIIGILSFLYLNLTSKSEGNKKTTSIVNFFSSDEDAGTNKTPQVSVFAQGLEVPWSVVFLPDKSMFITERVGRVRYISKDGTLQDNPVAVISEVKQIGEGGLHGISLHPNFLSNNYVYLYFTYGEENGNTKNKVVRYRFEGGKLQGSKVIVDNIPGAPNHDGGRIKFGPDGYLYITTGDAQEPSLAQDKNSLAGKILRVTDQGQPAQGNPFGNRVYSLGHRNPQGITWDDKGNLWETEHGPSGIWPNCCQDELNQIKIGGNYGWPNIVGDQTNKDIITSVSQSGRDIWAPAGLAYLDGAIYFVGLRGQALYKVDLQTKKIQTFFKEKFGRLRDVVIGPDNFLYITTSNRDGRGNPKAGDDKILRIDPTNL